MVTNEHKYMGFYRAKVTEVDIEDNIYGSVRVFIPALMTDIDPDFDSETMGLIAFPLNNYMGGYNPEDSDGSANFQASVHVPLKNSWVAIMFEAGNPNRPFYFAAFDYKWAEVPPECKDVEEPHKVHAMKMQSGRSVIMCDSEDQARVEITGLRKKLEEGGGGGGTGGVYEIDDNMNTILIDERDDQEKILIRTRKGDYVHIDVEEQQLQCYFKKDILIQTDANLHLKVKENLNISVDGNVSLATKGNVDSDTKGNLALTQGGTASIKSTGINGIDGSMTYIQAGRAQPASATAPTTPEGDRDEGGGMGAMTAAGGAPALPAADMVSGVAAGGVGDLPGDMAGGMPVGDIGLPIDDLSGLTGGLAAGTTGLAGGDMMGMAAGAVGGAVGGPVGAMGAQAAVGGVGAAIQGGGVGSIVGGAAGGAVSGSPLGGGNNLGNLLG